MYPWPITLITVYDNDIKERNIDSTIKQLNLDENTENPVFFSEVHHSLAKTSLAIFKDNYIIGVGPKLFRKYCQLDKYYVDNFSCSTHPHNIYLQLLAETGIIGLLFIIIPFLLIIFIFSHHFIKILNKSREKKFTDFEICLLICFFVSLWPFLPSQNFFNNWMSILYYLPVGFYLYSRSLKNVKDK